MGAEADAARLEGVRRIAVLRANALGDFVVTLPALESLRAAYPDAELTLLGKEWHRDFLAGRPGPVDRVVALPPVRGVSAADRADAPPGPSDGFLAAMRAARFDLALQLHGGGRFSNPFVRSLGARITAGLRDRDAEPLDRWTHFTHYQPEVPRFLEAVALVGARPVTIQPRIAVTAADLAEAARELPPDGSEGRPLVAVHAGASDPRRRWPADRFALVADAVAAVGARVVLTGSDAERALVGRVAAAMRRPAVTLAGKLSLAGLAGLLSRCALVVGSDTGPLHLARAVGTPTVAVYWVGNLINAGPAGRSIHRALISFTVACPVCGADATSVRCPHDPSFVEAVPAADVLAEALDLLGSPQDIKNGRLYL